MEEIFGPRSEAGTRQRLKQVRATLKRLAAERAGWLRVIEYLRDEEVRLTARIAELEGEGA